MTEILHSATGKFLFGALAAVYVLAVPAMARDIDPELRQTVILNCSQDAFRLCPQSLGNEHDAIACMRANHALLAQACRLAYDKVARVLSH